MTHLHKLLTSVRSVETINSGGSGFAFAAAAVVAPFAADAAAADGVVVDEDDDDAVSLESFAFASAVASMRRRK